MCLCVPFRSPPWPLCGLWTARGATIAHPSPAARQVSTESALKVMAGVLCPRHSGLASQGFRQVLCPKVGSSVLFGQPLRQRLVSAVSHRRFHACATQEGERFRLNNLSPQPGSKHRAKRLGRGHAAGQGGSAGRGMRGQNSRSGGGVKPGFEGGQMPLYRRLPKLRGIAGGMSAGLSKYNTVNLGELSAFNANEEVTLEALEAKRMLSLSGREGKLPLKVLGNGELSVALTIVAASFSESAKAKIEAAGGKAVVVPQRPKFTRSFAKERTKLRAEAAVKGKKAPVIRLPRKQKKKAAQGL